MAITIHRGSALASLSLTPLIDVIFLLLIFFLVATRFDQEEREIPVQLPSASEARPLTIPPEGIQISIDQQGLYFLGGQRMELAQIEQVLQEAARNNPANQTVTVKADRRVPVEHVVAVINACKKAGIQNPPLVVDQPTSRSPDPSRSE